MLKSLNVVFFLMLYSFTAGAAIKCEFLFITKEKFDRIYEPEKLSKKQSQKIIDAAGPEKHSGSTTGDRAEYKFTLTKKNISSQIEKFRNG